MSCLVCLENVSKKYLLPTRAPAPYRTLREEIARAGAAALRGLRRPAADAGQELWALRNLSLEVADGEVLGVIGRNGAGKSTLLKLLSRITPPTEGRIRLRGRLSCLLEVGTGFHPELTGRENIFLNGAILGMSRREIAARFDEIVAFADGERFLDMPVKHYSSGMQMRLAFAVAAHLDPEILLIDEVLAVGDAAFQRKCLSRIECLADGGRAIIFVSHNMSAVQALATRVVWLESGSLRQMGPPHEVVQKYLSDDTMAANVRTWDDPATAPGSEVARLRRVSVYPADGGVSEVITVDTALTLEFEYRNLVEGARLNLSVSLINTEGVTVFNSFPVAGHDYYDQPFPRGIFRSRCRVPAHLLNDGVYFVQLLVVADQAYVLSRHDAILSFSVADSSERRTSWHGKWLGVVRPALDWETEWVSRLDNSGDGTA
ncbi:MAG TPA: ABC transporter ATP-binding protein [Pirellulales bacterium]|nr:ABC transporter ATP-binding protein [Pirellulales bacterium]